MVQLFRSLKASYALAKRNRVPKPEGEEGMRTRGYQKMVGGMWNEIGQLQFDYMRKQGLQPQHVFCDVACGSFRAGRFFIDYLNPGNYLGIDKQFVLVETGRREVIGETTWQKNNPKLLYLSILNSCVFQSARIWQLQIRFLPI